jgi:hypothetical protein
MANKRMFSNKIIDTDKFRDLGQTAQALYFMLGMDTDDDGFVSFKKIQKLGGFAIDDLNVLKAKGLVIVFDNGIVVITHHEIHNYLQRRKPTIFQKEFRQLSLTKDKTYVFNTCLTNVELDEMRREESRGELIKNQKTLEIEKTGTEKDGDGENAKAEKEKSEFEKWKAKQTQRVLEHSDLNRHVPFAAGVLPTIEME